MVQSFSEILRDAKAGDDQAIRALIERHGSVLDRVLRSRMNGLVRKRFDTDDLRQSVLLEVLRDLPRFEDRGEAAFAGWLAVKAANKVRRKFRKLLTPDGRAREASLPDEEDPRGDSSPVLALVGNEDVEILWAALERLPEGPRRILLLRSSERITFEGIAGRLGLPGADAARKQYARAVLKLRSEWKKSWATPSPR